MRRVGPELVARQRQEIARHPAEPPVPLVSVRRGSRLCVKPNQSTSEQTCQCNILHQGQIGHPTETRQHLLLNQQPLISIGQRQIPRPKVRTRLDQTGRTALGTKPQAKPARLVGMPRHVPPDRLRPAGRQMRIRMEDQEPRRPRRFDSPRNLSAAPRLTGHDHAAKLSRNLKRPIRRFPVRDDQLADQPVSDARQKGIRRLAERALCIQRWNDH